MYTLYQFPFSHFCEKARWALRYKQQPFRVVNLLPGLHNRVILKLAPKSCMPVLVDSTGEVTQDSHRIIDVLDQRHPNPSLTPSSVELAAQAHQWETELDEQLGVPLRLWFYHHTLPDRQRAMGFLVKDAAWYGRPLLTLIYPKVEHIMRDRMGINVQSAQQAYQQVTDVLDRLDERISSHPYLVGDQFSRADLTAAALLSPMLRFHQPVEAFKARYVPVVQAFIDQLQCRPVYDWAEKMYALHQESHSPQV